MTEEQIKLLCKLAVENHQRQLTVWQKETIKHAIDEAKTIEELLAVMLSVLTVQ